MITKKIPSDLLTGNVYLPHQVNINGGYRKLPVEKTPQGVRPYGVLETINDNAKPLLCRHYLNPVRSEFEISQTDYESFFIKAVVTSCKYGTVKRSDGELDSGILTFTTYPFDDLPRVLETSEDNINGVADFVVYQGKLWRVFNIALMDSGVIDVDNIQNVECVLSKVWDKPIQQDNCEYDITHGHYTGDE